MITQHADKGQLMKDLKALGMSTGIVDAGAMENAAQNSGDENNEKDQVTIRMNQLNAMRQHENEKMMMKCMN